MFTLSPIPNGCSRGRVTSSHRPQLKVPHALFSMIIRSAPCMSVHFQVPTALDPKAATAWISTGPVWPLTHRFGSRNRGKPSPPGTVDIMNPPLPNFSQLKASGERPFRKESVPHLECAVEIHSSAYAMYISSMRGRCREPRSATLYPGDRKDGTYGLDRRHKIATV